MSDIITIVLINGKKLTGQNEDFALSTSFKELDVFLNVRSERIIVNANQIAYIRAAEDYEIEHYKLMGIRGV